jgi:general secretion pathway protein D
MGHAGRVLPLCVCFFLIASCSDSGIGRKYDPEKKHDVIDADRGLDRQDFKDLHNLGAYVDPNAQVNANVLEPPIPDLAEILAAPRPPKIAQAQLVSVAVTDDVPLKDVLVELARLADIDIEVDPAITGGIIFRAKDRPFNEVIERISDLAGLRYRVQNNVLRVERDLPFIQTYTLDMLNERAQQGSTLTSASSSGASSSSSGGSASAGASAAAGSSGSTTDPAREEFWRKFEAGVSQIIAYKPVSLVSTTDMATQPTAPTSAANNTAAPAAAPVIAPTPIPASPTGNSSNDGVNFTLNRQAGTLTVLATDRQHEMIKQFIRAVDANVSSQVLIEAKIVEVSLNDLYQTGIDWSKIGTSINFRGDLDRVQPSLPRGGAAQITLLKDNFLGGADLSVAMSLLNEFGTTRALSSPRLSAMNNQKAVLSFVENLLYFEVDCEVTPGTAATQNSPALQPTIEVDSEKREEPLGIILNLQPSINRETNEVTLGIKPVLSRLVKVVSDPGFELCKAQALSQPGVSSDVIDALVGIKSEFPQVEKRELDSILKIKSGQVMVIGGLLEDRVVNNDSGVPGVSEVPYLGNFFKTVEKTNQKKELVILIRATIVDSQGYMDAADKGIYKKFIQDPRPIIFPEAQ